MILFEGAGGRHFAFVSEAGIVSHLLLLESLEISLDYFNWLVDIMYRLIQDFTFRNEVGVFACADVFRMIDEISIFILNFPGLLCVNGLV